MAGSLNVVCFGFLENLASLGRLDTAALGILGDGFVAMGALARIDPDTCRDGQPAVGARANLDLGFFSC